MKIVDFVKGIIPIVLIIIYGVFLSWIALQRHWSLGSYYYDLGIMHQIVYNTAYGQFLMMTDPNSQKQILRFAIHFDPLMAIFSPLYWIFPKAEVLLIGQTLALVSGAIPIYFLAQRILKKTVLPQRITGLLFVFLYLNYYPLAKINMFDFHAVTLAVPLLLWTLYFAEIGKFKLSFIMAVISLLAKENVPLITFMIGLYYFFIKKNHRFGLLLSIVSVVVFLTVIGFVIPSQRTNIHFAISLFSFDIKTNIIRLFSQESFIYIKNVLQPLGFISLFAPIQLLISLPEWLINLLSKNTNMRNLQYHYVTLLIPFIFFSAMYGLKNINAFFSKRITLLIVVWIFFINIVTAIQFGPLKELGRSVDKKKLAVIQEWVEILKDDNIPVSTSGHLAPYFSGRKYFYNFLFDFAYENFNQTESDIKAAVTRYEKADYVLIQQSEMENPHPLVKYYYNHLKNNKKFQLIFNQEGIEVYKKVNREEESSS